MSQHPSHRRTEQADDRRQQTAHQPHDISQRPPQQHQPQQQSQQPLQQHQPVQQQSRPRQQPQRQPHQQQPQRPVQQQPRQQQPRQATQQTEYQSQQPRASGVRKIAQGNEYVHVRFRNPDDFETIRTPDWAAHAAQSVASGAEVRTGKLKGSGEWQTESVLIPAPVDGQTAARLATQIVEKIGE